MSERKNKPQDPSRSAEMQRELTRKEERLHQRDRDRHRKLYIFVGAAIGAALLFVVIGVIYQFLILPNQQVAKVGDVTVTANQFWKRVKLDQNQLRNDLVRYQQLEQQFGGQGFFTSQISQIQSTLSSPFLLGQQTLNSMLDDLIVEREAAARGIAVTDEEVEQALRDQIANGFGLVTEPQATATVQAGANATATAAVWTPTPAPTIDISATITATATPIPTPPVPPTPSIITETLFSEGLTNLQNNVNQVSGMSMDEYRQIIRANLLREKLQEVIADETVTTTEEAVHARHILLSVREPEPEPTPLPDGAPTPEPTLTPTPLPEGFPTPAPTPGPRDDAETLALAQEIRQRLVDGEDFATLAAEYSDDPGSAANGGDLGWFGKGRMVAPFEEAAFALAVNEISEPVKTDFGYHIIEVLERDDAREKDTAQIDQERAQAFDTWLQEQRNAADVQKPENLANLLPTGL